MPFKDDSDCPPPPPLTDDYLTELLRIYEEEEDTGDILASLPDMVAEIRDFRLLKSALKFMDNESFSISEFAYHTYTGREWVCGCEPEEIIEEAKRRGWKP